MPTTTSSVTCRTLLATYPTTAALKRGDVSSPLVTFDFADVRHANTAFKALVRDQQFDVGELAIVTYLQARAFGKPYVLLPAVVVRRSQHHSMLYNPSRGRLHPSDLRHRRVGVRSYTQTTGAWLRAILEEEYGIDFREIEWVTFEDPHLSEYCEPPWVERALGGKGLLQMLLDGELDAAIFGNELPDAPLAPLMTDADAAAARWADQHGGVPINHMVVVRDALVRHRPDVVREIFRLLVESKRAVAAERPDRSLRFGVEPNRRCLELIIEYAFRQHLIPHRVSVDELFDDVTRSLEES